MQGENAGYHAKIMAHREWHAQEMDGLRRQLRQECDEKVSRAPRLQTPPSSAVAATVYALTSLSWAVHWSV